MGQEHSATLLNLTGDLWPVPGTPPDALLDLRQTLLGALRNGQDPADTGLRNFIGEPADGAEEEIRNLGDGAVAPTNARILRRAASVAAADPLIGGPRWATGQTPDRTIGPFQDRGGRLHWFDVFEPKHFFRIFQQGDPEPIALLPFGTTAAGAVLNVPAGSVWLRAPMIDANVPGGTWVGLRIESATGAPGGSLQLTPGGILLRQQGGIRFTLNLATDGLADFPASASIAVSINGIRILDLAAGSATAFGETVTFAGSGAAPGFDNLLAAVVLPLTPDASRFSADEAPVSGMATIRRASWALPLTEASPATLAEAEGPGWIALLLDAGLEASLPGIEGGAMALGRSYVLASPGGTRVFSPAAANPRATQTLEAWFEDRVERRSTFELRWPAPFPFWFLRETAGAEAAFTRGSATLHIDRPLRASGQRLESRIAVRHLVERDADGSRVTLIGAQTIDPSKRSAIALSNALLTVAETNALELFAMLHTPVEMEKGQVQFRLPLFQLLPMLPDPYAVNFDVRRTEQPGSDVRVAASVIWTEPFAAQLDLRLDPPPFNMFSTREALPEPRPFRQRDQLTGRLSETVPQIVDAGLTLVDVSTNEAQFGVVLGYNDRPGAGIAIRNLTLNIHGSNATLLMLPQFQWEPSFNVFNKNVADEPEGWRYSPDDGGPTQVAADTVRLVPVRPLMVLDEVTAAYTKDQRNAALLFTLPFGIRALAQLNPLDRAFRKLPRLEITSPRFEGLDGAPQLNLIAGTQTDGQISISGQSETVAAAGTNSLGRIIGDAYNASFGGRVPIDRVAFSGYGASLFSRWVLAADDPVGITQVTFDAFNGRTSYERVLMTTELLPCFARMVRTITFERRGGGAVVRWDSGWVATTPGLFTYSGHTSNLCAVQGLYNIREVRDTAHIVEIAGKKLQAVYFDADAAMENVVRGGDANGRVPARRHLGFIQLLTIPEPGNPVDGSVISPAGLCQLLDQEAPVGGPVDCEIRIGDSQHTMKVTSILAANAGNTQFSVGPCGIPSLQGPGTWSVTRVNNGSGAVDPVTGTRGIPLVRATGGPFRWAEPADLFQNTPASDYAFLFSSSAQRILFRRPKVDSLARTITSTLPMLLADPYAMLKGSKLFPSAKQLLPSAATWSLDTAAGALRLANSAIAVGPGFSLLKTGTWDADFDYADAGGAATAFTIDAVNWAIKSTGVRQVLHFPVVGEVMTIVHQMEAPPFGDDSFPDPEVRFPPALALVTDVLRILQDWAPNLPAPLKVDPSFSGSTFRLSAVADFQIQNDEGNAIDCGMGKLKGDLKLGAELSVEIFKGTTNGAVFFEVTGSWQQQIFPALYGGGLLRFKIRADSDGQIALELDACVTGSVGGDLIPGLISVEATVKYGYFLFTNPIMPGFLAGIEGRAKLLDGLLGFKFGVEGRIGIERNPEHDIDLDHICNLHGEILVSGTVTLAWLVHERKSFRTHFDVNVSWETALLAVKLGLLPVP